MTAATVETTLSRAAFEAQLEKFTEQAQVKARADFAERFPTMGWKDTFTLTVQRGPKFVRVVQTNDPADRYGRSVHCFVEIATGKVVKAAGWKAPAKRSNGELQSQFSIATDESLAALLAVFDTHGGYLYLR